MINYKTLSIFGILLFALSSNASAIIDADAEQVLVSKSCTKNGNPVDDCFTSFSDLTTWLSTIRKPDISAPLAVTIGAGVFGEDITLSCQPASDYTGYISFSGMGNGQTIIQGQTFNSPLNVSNCTDLSFTHLTINGPKYGGITWSGGGHSKWVDVDVNGAARAWYEPVCGSERGEHYWYSSKVTATAGFTLGVTYQATCDETWFFGSEVTLNIPEGEKASGATVMTGSQGILHLYGSVLRTLVEDYRALSGGVVSMAAARAGTIPFSNTPAGGEIHIHGTGIDVLSSNGQQILALYADNGGHIHANNAAYNLQSSGTITRLKVDGGHISAPYQWKQNTEAPDIVSITGADTVVVTNTTDNRPHTLIYDNTCSSGWYDTATTYCR